MQADINDLKARVKSHKKALLAAGFTVTAAAGIYLGIKNKDSLARLWESLHGIIKTTSPTTFPNIGHTIATNIETGTAESLIPVAEKVTKTSFEQVNSHIRRLPQGQKASLAKIMAAQELGIVLEEGYTFVASYPRERQIAA